MSTGLFPGGGDRRAETGECTQAKHERKLEQSRNSGGNKTKENAGAE